MTAPVDSKPRRRLARDERAQQLLDTAEQLFVERGYAAVTLKDIAQAAGVSRPILYEHYPSKERVFLACVERARKDFADEFFSQLEPSTEDRRAQIAFGAHAYFSTLASDPARFTMLLYTRDALPLDTANELERLRKWSTDQIANLLRMSAPDTDPARVEAAAEAISGTSERLWLWWRTKPHMPQSEVEEHYTTIVHAIVERGMRAA